MSEASELGAVCDPKPQITKGKVVTFAVGSTNPSKMRAVEMAVTKLFRSVSTEVKVVCVKAKSGVDDQPKSANETVQGAINRAKHSLELLPEADFGVGLEGGIEQIGERWFECGWIAAVDREGRIGIGSSARFEVSPFIVKQLFSGRELADVIDDLSGQTDVRSDWGMMGVITNGHLPRSDCYSQGVQFAFAPFVSDARYWQQ